MQALQWIADNAEYPALLTALVTALVSGGCSGAMDQAVSMPSWTYTSCTVGAGFVVDGEECADLKGA